MSCMGLPPENLVRALMPDIALALSVAPRAPGT